jgi:hypothetical protein
VLKQFKEMGPSERYSPWLKEKVTRSLLFPSEKRFGDGESLVWVSTGVTVVVLERWKDNSKLWSRI